MCILIPHWNSNLEATSSHDELKGTEYFQILEASYWDQ